MKNKVSFETQEQVDESFNRLIAKLEEIENKINLLHDIIIGKNGEERN